MALLAILWLGFGLRLYRLGDQNIWWDEGHAVWAARQSLAQVTDITARDVHPPLYLWMLHVWMRSTGQAEFAVRYLSMAGGTLTIALTYAFARRLFGLCAGLSAGLLIALARFHIWWSQEARMYVWATFLVLLSTYLMMRWMTRSRDTRFTGWLLYVLASAAALYTLYLSVLALLLQNLFVALTVWRGPGWRHSLFKWILAQLGVLVLYAPWLYVALTRIRTDSAKTPFPFYRIWQLYGTVLATGISTDLDRYVWLLVPFALLAIAGIALLLLGRCELGRSASAGREAGLFFLLVLVLPPLVTSALSVPRGFFYSPKPEARYLLLFAPFAYTLLAGTTVCIGQRGRWGQIAAFIVAALILATFVGVLPAHYAGRYLRDDYQTAVGTLAAYAQPGDAVLLVSGDRYPVFLYHYDRRFPAGDGPEVYLMPQHSTYFTPENVESELAPLADQHSRLWLASFERALQDPENLVEGWLDAHRTAALSVPLGHNDLRLYADENGEPTVNPSAIRLQRPLRDPQPLGEGVTLVGYDQATSEFRPGDTLRLALYLAHSESRTSQQSPAQVAVDWVHQDGHVIATQTLAVPVPGDPTQLTRALATFKVYEYTPPGWYWVDVYTPQEPSDAVRLPAGQVTHSRRLPRPRITNEQRVQVQNGAVEFLGYSLRPPSQVQAGKPLTVDLYWRAQRPLAADYTVFVHLLGQYNPATGGPLWVQDDSYPLGGGHPTTRWLPGQIVRDRHSLTLPADTPPGSYQIEVGLYDARTGQRLEVAESDEDRILLGNIHVTP